MNALLILSLLHLKGVGRRVAWKLVRSHPPPEESSAGCLRAWLAAHPEATRLKELPSLSDLASAIDRAGELLEAAAALHVDVLTPADANFPSQLLGIPDPPLLLYLRGDGAALKVPSLAVVGTRKPSPFGSEMAARIGQRVARRGLCVVSGLAIGCDAHAHRGALDAGGKAVAVLPSGVDAPYPRTNSALAEEILHSGGCLLSEYPPGSIPFSTNFVDRDRLQSGLSAGVVVVETGRDGGTMHTARFAREQRRLIGVLVHSPDYDDDVSIQGNRDLLSAPTTRPLASLRDIDTLCCAAELKWRDLFSTAVGRPTQQMLTGHADRSSAP